LGSPGVNVKIELYRGVLWAGTISATTATSQLSFAWTIPADVVQDTTYTIHVTYLDTTTATGTSVTFTISIPVPTALYLDSADDTGISNTMPLPGRPPV